MKPNIKPDLPTFLLKLRVSLKKYHKQNAVNLTIIAVLTVKYDCQFISKFSFIFG